MIKRSALVAGVGALDNPTLGQGYEAVRVLPDLEAVRLHRADPTAHDAAGGGTNHFDAKAVVVLDALDASASVGAVDEEGSDLGVFLRRPCHGRQSGFAILRARRADAYRQQQPQGIDHPTALAALDLLAGVEAARPAWRGAARGWRVEHRGAGRRNVL
jgi:hypothetical protein